MRILLVEDEPRAAQVLSKGLREQAYAVDVARDGDDALYQASITDYDAIVLDVMLPGIDGLDVYKRQGQDAAAGHEQLPGERGRRVHDVRRGQSCLLYTSRCV